MDEYPSPLSVGQTNCFLLFGIQLVMSLQDERSVGKPLDENPYNWLAALSVIEYLNCCLVPFIHMLFSSSLISVIVLLEVYTACNKRLKLWLQIKIEFR